MTDLRALLGDKYDDVMQWPDWRTADPNKAIEHVRALDGGAES